jgi:hypothetical protein
LITDNNLLQKQSQGFQPANPTLTLDVESLKYFLFGKHKIDKSSSRQFYRFDEQQFERNEKLIHKNSPKYREKIIFYDGYEAETLNSFLDNLLSKH